jgi:hypothetical protein
MPANFLTASEKGRLSGFPHEVPLDDLFALFSLTGADRAAVPSRASPPNCLGFALRYAEEVAGLVAEGANPYHAPFDAPSYTEKNAAEEALLYGLAVLYHLEHGSLEGYEPPAELPAA